MPITVTCPCGREYSKPDHKAGTSFRCHVCGRELLIAGEPAPFRLAPLEPEEIPPPPPRPSKPKPAHTPRRSRKRLVLRYDYPLLWAAAAFLVFLGGCFIVSCLATAAPANAPGKAPAGPSPFIVLIIAGSVFAGLGVLLGWTAHP